MIVPLMLRIVAVLLWVLLTMGVARAQSDALAFPPDGTVIRSLQFTGTERVPPADIEEVMSLRQGSEFTRQAYRRDLQALANLGTLDPIATRIQWKEGPDGLAVEVAVKENPVIQQIEIVGNVRYSRKRILTELGYEIGEIQQTGIRASTIRNLSSFYRDGGFKDVRVSVTLDAVTEPAAGVAVRITIDERERIRIRKVEFRGNTHFNSFIAGTRLTNSPSILFFPNYYDESALEDDLAVLRGMYENAGDLDAKVERGDFEYDEAKKEVALVFIVEQGPRYKIADVRSEGVTYYTPEEIDDTTKRLEGRTFNGKRLGRAMASVRRLYGDQGYIDTAVGFRLDKRAEERTADVILTVKESGISYVGNVTIDMEEYDVETEIGPVDRFLRWLVPPTNKDALMKEVRLKSGEKFRTVDQVRTEERLRNLGFLREVSVNPVPTTDPTVKDAEITVEEDPSAAYVGVTGGIGEVSGPSVTLSLVQPNMGGVANRLEIAYTIGFGSNAWRVTYFDRYLGDTKNSLETSIYRSSERYRAYRQRTTGASTELGRPLTEYLSTFVRVRGEKIGFVNETEDATEENFDNYYVLAVRPTLVYDRRDNRFWTTRGYLVSGGVEAGAADGFLLQFLHSLEWYHQFERSDWVYAYRHRVGLSPFEATEVGLGERFFLGGSSSLRGFRARGVGPTDRGDDQLHLGGATRLSQTHELRYPFNDFLRGRIFTDIGVLERDPLEIGGPRIGSGAGIMVDLGALQLEVDLATAVLKERTDRRQFLHLRLGSRF